MHPRSEPDYLDRNYGGVLILWDACSAFSEGTRRRAADLRPGAPDDTPQAQVKIAFAEWMAMLCDLRGARSLRDLWGYLFGPPGWSPDGSRATTASIRAAAGIPEDSRQPKNRPPRPHQWQS